MNNRHLFIKAIFASFAAFFVIAVGFWSFEAFALTSLSKSLSSNENQNTNTNETVQDGAQQVETQTDLILLVDASGSMTESFGDTTKIQSVQAALSQAVDSVIDAHNVSLFAVGSKESSQDKEKSCSDVAELSHGLDLRDGAAIKGEINKITPKGNSPLALGISELENYFKTEISLGTSHVVLLVVDGADNCDGDIVKAATQLMTNNPDTKIFSIGLNVSEAVGKDLAQVAQNGKGQYFLVEDQNGLTSAALAVSKAVQSATAPTSKNNPVVVSGGATFDEARVFTKDDFGKVFTLKDHLNADAYQYWKLDLLPGQGAEINVSTGGKDVSFVDGEARETDDAPSAGIRIFNDKQEKLFDVSVQQEKNAAKNGEIFSVSSEKKSYTFYVGVGYSLPVHKDMTFSINLIEAYDEPMGAGDAPNNLKSQLVSLKEGAQIGYLSKSDIADYYSVPVLSGQTVALTGGVEDPTSYISLELYSPAGDLVTSADGAAAGEGVSIEYTATEDMNLSLGVKDVIGKYSLSLATSGEHTVAQSEIAPMITTDGKDLIRVDESSAQSGLSSLVIKWIIIIGVSAVLIALVLIAVFIFLSKKKQKTQASAVSLSHDLDAMRPSVTEVRGLGKDVSAHSDETRDNKPS